MTYQSCSYNVLAADAHFKIWLHRSVIGWEVCNHIPLPLGLLQYHWYVFKIIFRKVFSQSHKMIRNIWAFGGFSSDVWTKQSMIIISDTCSSNDLFSEMLRQNHRPIRWSGETFDSELIHGRPVSQRGAETWVWGWWEGLWWQSGGPQTLQREWTQSPQCSWKIDLSPTHIHTPAHTHCAACTLKWI